MFLSIRTKFFLILLLALIVATFIFGVIKEVGDFLVWRYYLDEESKIERSLGYIQDFQDYVTENKLSVNDSGMISKWSGGSYVDIIIYKDSNLLYAPEWFIDVEGEDGVYPENNETGTALESSEETAGEGEELEESESTLESESEETTIKDNGWFSGDRGFEQYLTQEAKEAYLARLSDIMSGNRQMRPVYFVDGTVLVTVVDYSEEFMNSLVFALSIITAIIVFLFIMLISFSSTLTRIKRLAKKVRLVESGALDTAIKVGGNDEIAALAVDVNSMKDAVIENMSKEQRAWEANTELITAMSHDIRTPLTVMLGYLDLLEMQDDEESRREYIGACKENALRLKRLSDDMFSYFLVFGKREVSIDLDKTYACDSITHMIAERVFWLEEKEYSVELSLEADDRELAVDPVFLGRVFDNVFSNIEKYADASQSVKISSVVSEEGFELIFANRVRHDGVKAESNGIGTKTCKRIMEKMNGSFVSEETDQDYVARIRIPWVLE